MMNARVLELLQRPENISKEDIALLQKEISKYPYMQSIRTLQLSAIFNFDAENYQKELTKTAAYTTDKKILYTFINKKNEEEKKEATKFKKILLAKSDAAEETSIFISDVPKSETEKKDAEKPVVTHPKNVVGDTELETPILDKKENEFEVFNEEKALETPQNSIGDTELETPILDKKENEFEVIKELETLEAENKFIEEKAEEKPNVVFKTREEDLNFSKETILEHIDKIAETDKEISAVKPSDISFNGFESFLPDVKFTVPSAKKEEPQEEISAPIIEEKPVEVETKNDEVSFENVQDFEISTPIKVETSVEKTEEIIVEAEKSEEINAEILVEEKSDVEEDKIDVSPELSITEEPEVHTEWKPMNFVMNPLDSTIKKAEVSAPKTIEKPIENKVEVSPSLNVAEEKAEEKMVKEEPKTEISEPEKEERPVLNVSFFGNNVQEIKTDVTAPQNVKNEMPEKTQQETAQSNIPNFVNTWQSWLKIDRTQSEKPTETIPVKVIEKKADIIDKFIEDNPKISQLKDESNFVVKEKNDDISHLMTETLAKLYTEQRLYTKAIKAYEILQKKHPEKAEDFKAKIQEIRDLKQGK